MEYVSMSPLLNYEILIIISSEIKACDVSKDQNYLPSFLPEAWPFVVTQKNRKREWLIGYNLNELLIEVGAIWFLS